MANLRLATDPVEDIIKAGYEPFPDTEQWKGFGMRIRSKPYIITTPERWNAKRMSQAISEKTGYSPTCCLDVLWAFAKVWEECAANLISVDFKHFGYLEYRPRKAGMSPNPSKAGKLVHVPQRILPYFRPQNNTWAVMPQPWGWVHRLRKSKEVQGKGDWTTYDKAWVAKERDTGEQSFYRWLYDIAEARCDLPDPSQHAVERDGGLQQERTEVDTALPGDGQ